MVANSGYQYTIPSCLKSGYYLVRHEIIALHAAYSYPGAQFYPGCHQLQVTGSGTKTATSLVAIPGAYKSTDPGITYDAYKGILYHVSRILGSLLTFDFLCSANLHYSRPGCVHLLSTFRFVVTLAVARTELVQSFEFMYILRQVRKYIPLNTIDELAIRLDSSPTSDASTQLGTFHLMRACRPQRMHVNPSPRHSSNPDFRLIDRDF